MKKKIKKNNYEVRVFALGGLGEVGKNCYCIEFKDQIFIIDCGVLFSDENLLGIDYVIPEFTYLVENKEKIKGLFITHGHEDHIGAIPYLLSKVNIPCIYAPKMAYDLIVSKLKDRQILDYKIEMYQPNSVFKFDEIVVKFARVSHSIPDSFGIIVETPLGAIFETGDFKMDMTPVGPHAEYHKLTQMSMKKTLLLMSDSTNAERTEMIESEKKIGESISNIFADIQGRVIIATFASNVYRIKQILDASFEYGRKISILGKSMEKVVEISRKNKFIDIPDKSFIKPEEIENLDNDNVTILCTGSQGESLAVLSKIANNTHKLIKAKETDTVIFSSSPIPGNQQAVNKTINQLQMQGVDVITHGPLFDTHTSGHASQDGLKLMINLCNPKYFMPIHGEHRMQVIHADLAVDTGMKSENTFVMDNGDVLVMRENEAFLEKQKINAQPIYIEGSVLTDISSTLIKERKDISKEGIILINFILDNQNKLVSNIQIDYKGFINEDNNLKINDRIIDIVNKYLMYEKFVSDSKTRSDLVEKIISFIQERLERKPYIILDIFRLDKK